MITIDLDPYSGAKRLRVRLQGPRKTTHYRSPHQWHSYVTDFDGAKALVGHYYNEPGHDNQWGLDLLEGKTACPACLEMHKPKGV